MRIGTKKWPRFAATMVPIRNRDHFSQSGPIFHDIPIKNDELDSQRTATRTINLNENLILLKSICKLQLRTCKMQIKKADFRRLF